jgi:hypothetical protein
MDWSAVWDVMSTEIRTKQFWLHQLATVAPFVIIGTAIVSLGVDPAIAYIAGYGYSLVGDRITEWFIEWRKAEKRVEEVSPDA